MFARSMASLLSARIVLPGHFEALVGLRSSLQDAGGDKHKGPQFLSGSAACRVSMLLFAFGNDSVSYRIKKTSSGDQRSKGSSYFQEVATVLTAAIGREAPVGCRGVIN